MSGPRGGHLRQARQALGLSQEALARRADCSTAYVRLLERGFEPQRSDVLPRIAQALGLTTIPSNESRPPAQAPSTKSDSLKEQAAE